MSRQGCCGATPIERELDAGDIRQLTQSSARDVTIGGAELAGRAMAAGLADECQLLRCPMVLGGGKRALPDDVRLQLELLHEHRFGCSVVHLRYGVGV